MSIPVIDERTPGAQLQLPHPQNKLEDDVLRLRHALQSVDVLLGEIATQLQGKALDSDLAAAVNALQLGINGLSGTVTYLEQNKVGVVNGKPGPAVELTPADIGALSLWSSLTGALNKPASVFHNGAFWALLNNLADVTTSQPGVSADWQVVSGGFPIFQIAVATNAVPWRTYVITAACPLTFPAVTGDGKEIRVIVLPAVNGATLVPAGTDKVRGVAGTMTFDVVPFDKIFKDSGAALGWV